MDDILGKEFERTASIMNSDLSDTYLNEIRRILTPNKNLNQINEELRLKTGVLDFFSTRNDFNKFRSVLNPLDNFIDIKRDMGDFQTPSSLTDRICEYLSKIGLTPAFLIEPTCGKGNFILSALKYFPSLKHIYCIDVQSEYEWLLKLKMFQYSFQTQINADLEFHRDNIFTHQISERFRGILKGEPEEILILGNPPWITNTELSTLNSNNLPLKSNIKDYKGIEAITGKGNFDIAENIIMQIIQRFSKYKGKIAILCKTSVIRNLVKDMAKLDLKLANSKSLLIDAKKEFSINTDAALFLADIGYETQKECKVSSLYDPDKIYRTFGWFNGKFVSDIQTYKNFRYIDGKSRFIWRQGLKHDASKIMILEHKGKDLYVNGLDEQIELEGDRLFPFLKSSDLQNHVIRTCIKRVIVTQKSLKENTDQIAKKSPKLWDYLDSHSGYLDKRKSVIYKKRPRFSIFGVGEYAFKPYKIGISGFYKTPNFCLIFPINGKPVMLDDTSYYLPFNNFEDAFFTYILLNMNEIKDFLLSIVFLDSKRPFTKEKLMRISLYNLLDSISFDQVLELYKEKYKQTLPFDFTKNTYEKYIKKINQQ